MKTNDTSFWNKSSDASTLVNFSPSILEWTTKQPVCKSEDYLNSTDTATSSHLFESIEGNFARLRKEKWLKMNATAIKNDLFYEFQATYEPFIRTEFWGKYEFSW